MYAVKLYNKITLLTTKDVSIFHKKYSRDIIYKRIIKERGIELFKLKIIFNNY
jgi:hypothetical protein